VEGSHNFFAEGVLVHNCLIIDDPFKNPEEANSPIIRDKVWEWYRGAALTRLEPGGGVLLIQTRWHEDDLAGRCLTEEARNWTVVNFPAIAEEEDVLGRQPGDALWPERYNEEHLAVVRFEQGSYLWSALYQQRPQPAEGGLFKREHFRYWRPATHNERQAYDVAGTLVAQKDTWRFFTIDLAASKKTTADWTVCAVWAVTPGGDLLLLDRERMRLEGPDHLPMVRRLNDKWRPRYVGVERATYGISLIQSALREVITCLELRPDRDKVARALQASTLCEQGRVFFPAQAAWLGEWESELLGFPTATHDDQVDVFAYAAIQLAQGALRGKRRRKFEPATLEERAAARFAKRRKKDRNHPVLGRWG
jgi:predicted phage terminase large subunit-like protein